MDSIPWYFNLAEAGLWILVALAISVHDVVKAQLSRHTLILSITFLAFGISDLVETQTGAWYRPAWLLLLKAGCLAVLATYFVRYIVRRKLA